MNRKQILKPKASSLEDKSLARMNKRKRHTQKSQYYLNEDFLLKTVDIS